MQGHNRHPSRFTYEAPGWVQVARNLIWPDWRSRCRAWVTDHQRGERFQLSDADEAMMDVLLENMHAVADAARVPLWRSNRFWTPTKIDIARDRVLTAISERRHGNLIEWQRLEAMRPEDWMEWLRNIDSGGV